MAVKNDLQPGWVDELVDNEVTEAIQAIRQSINAGAPVPAPDLKPLADQAIQFDDISGMIAYQILSGVNVVIVGAGNCDPNSPQLRAARRVFAKVNNYLVDIQAPFTLYSAEIAINGGGRVVVCNEYQVKKMVSDTGATVAILANVSGFYERDTEKIVKKLMQIERGIVAGWLFTYWKVWRYIYPRWVKLEELK